MTGIDQDTDDDLFAPEPDSATGGMATAAEAGPPWKVLIVDDDPGVHDATRFALGSLRFRDRPIQLLHAYSGAEAIALTEAHDDLALIFLDVVMETDDAGLRVARHLRQVLERLAVRIVLRTGQPGQAPVRKVIIDYDINDYKEKTELVADRLFVTTVAALRGYEDIRTIERFKDAAYATLNLESGVTGQVVDAVATPLLVTDPMQSVTACNGAAAALLGREPGTVVGLSLYELLPAAALDRLAGVAPGDSVVLDLPISGPDSGRGSGTGNDPGRLRARSLSDAAGDPAGFVLAAWTQG